MVMEKPIDMLFLIHGELNPRTLQSSPFFPKCKHGPSLGYPFLYGNMYKQKLVLHNVNQGYMKRQICWWV